MCWSPPPIPPSVQWSVSEGTGHKYPLLVGWAHPHQHPPHPADSFWNPNAFETDSDLPAGWMRVQDTSGTYYWHIPTGTTQWEPPGRASPSQGNSPQEESQVSSQVFCPGMEWWCCWGKMSHPFIAPIPLPSSLGQALPMEKALRMEIFGR